jgi:hypothetical protein
MRLGVKPHVFFLKALVVFFLTYLLWSPIAPPYTRFLAWITEAFLHLTELVGGDANTHSISKLWVEGTTIYFGHRLFPGARFPGIPAEWVQANMVLLIPLMLATPAATYRQRFGRLALALALALLMQVLDLAVTVKSAFSTQLGEYSFRYYSDSARWWYNFADAFSQSFDTQLFPFAIWAGIHFRQLVGWKLEKPEAAAPARSERRRHDRTTKKVRRA